MKIIAVALSLSILASGVSRGATAYEALQTLRLARGDAILRQLVEVRGEAGEPQPQSWIIVMQDPSARGGIREFVVSGKDILSERTPLRGYDNPAKLPTLDFTRLNLDSDGAFRVAEKQAVSKKLGFNTVDYTLQTNAATGAPLWSLRLSDYMGAPVGNIQVSAENGSVIRPLQIDVDSRQTPAARSTAQRQPPPPAEQPPTRTTNASSAPSEKPAAFPGGIFGFVERHAKEDAEKVKNTALRIGGTVQEIFTGERTIDRSVSDDE